MDNVRGKEHPLLDIVGLTKTYCRRNGQPINALNGISLSVFQGEFVVLTGLSGSGKTTLLNILGALDRPTSGAVIFEGKNVVKLSSVELATLRRSKIGFVFQTFNLLPSLTVYENLEVALIHSEVSKKERRKQITALLDSFELADMSDRLPLELSVGQQQRVAMARALANEPVLVLADEPTGEMDPVAGREIAAKLRELNSGRKVTVIVASHGTFPCNQKDRGVFIRNGKIVSQKEAGY